MEAMGPKCHRHLNPTVIDVRNMRTSASSVKAGNFTSLIFLPELIFILILPQNFTLV